MKINEIKNGNELTLALAGELDLTGAPALTAFAEGKLEGINALTLDMSGITYLSSAGIRAVLGLERDLNGKGFKIIGCNELVYEVFEITGLNEVFDIQKA